MKTNSFENVRLKSEKLNISTTSAVLIALGAILHTVIPSAGIKPDFMLATMFVALSLNPNIKHALSVGVVCSILAAMTTGFPGGQIPQFIDKISTSLIFIFVYSNMKSKIQNIKLYQYGILYFVSTIISGTIFVYSAMFLGRLMGLAENILLFKAGAMVLITGVVIPTAVLNAFFGALLTKVLQLCRNK